jgi:hypothetical protein
MAWTMWAYQFKDESWSRVPWKWYERFTAGTTAVTEPEGTLLRFALVSVELDDRERERAKYPSFVVHEVTDQGLINMDREAQARHAAAEMTFDGLLAKTKDGDSNVIAASSKFARRQYQHLATWEPTHDQNEALLRALRSEGVAC